MGAKTVIDEKLYNYILAANPPLTPLQEQLREETLRLPMAQMQIAQEQGPLLALLIKLIGAKNALEVGVFTGYSSLVVAQALPEDGRLIACDVSEEWTQVARRYWAEAGISHKVDLRIAPAIETLDKLIDDGNAGSFDFAFIDADKTGYDAYYERALRLIRVGGLIVIDNTLMGGTIADDDNQSEGVVAVRALNRKLAADDRIALCALAVADGLALIVKL